MPQNTPIALSGSNPGPRAELIADAVITAYIHEISERHRRPESAETLEESRHPV